MFAYIKGTVEDINENGIVIESNDIGFDILCSRAVISSADLHKEMKVYTHLNVKEDDMSLFGFIDKEERRIFRLLIGISGIGPKGALAILSTLSLDELKMAVISEDYKAISKANGIGKKTAERIVLELKDKFTADSMDSSAADQQTVSETGAGSSDGRSEAVSALIALGYTRGEATSALAGVKETDLTAEEYIKLALKNLF